MDVERLLAIASKRQSQSELYLFLFACAFAMPLVFVDLVMDLSFMGFQYI